MPSRATINLTTYSRYVYLTRSAARGGSVYATAQAFLSQEMMYSCALWGPGEGGVDGDIISGPTPGDLEAAQLRKIRHILNKARVRPGHRILEFGSGWGGLAIEVCERSYNGEKPAELLV